LKIESRFVPSFKAPVTPAFISPILASRKHDKQGETNRQFDESPHWKDKGQECPKIGGISQGNGKEGVNQEYQYEHNPGPFFAWRLSHPQPPNSLLSI
jgi:hypothetical protein